MDPISNDELATLLTRREGPCASIFMPTVRAGAETQQNAIRFKNLLRRVESGLLERGLRKTEADELLRPAVRLIDDHPFWQHQDAGLAIFLAPRFDRRYRLPLAFDELAVVEDRFHVKPLFPLLNGDGSFYLLALAKNRVRLFTGSRFKIAEVELADVPQSLADALGHELTEPQIQVHSGGAARAGQAAVYHGQGAGEEEEKTELRKFFNVLDRALADFLADKQAPLVLAGVDYLLPIYREVTRYPRLADGGIAGNPEELSPEQLHAKAWPLVEPRFLAAREAAAAKYRRLAGTGLATNRLDEAVPAAFDGRIEALFVARGVRRWGAFDEASRDVRIDGGQAPQSEDLLDLAAVQTHLHGGIVHAVEAGQVPGGEALAAVFRY